MRYLRFVVLLGLCATLALAGCGDGKDEAEALPEARPLLEEAVTKIQEADSFQLEISVSGYPVQIDVGNFELPEDFPLVFQYAEGGFVAPDQLEASVQVTLGDLGTTVQMIALGRDQYMQSDLLTQDRWIKQEIIPGFTPASLMAADGGITDALSSINNLAMVGREDLDGLDVYHISGTVEASEVYSITFGLIGTTAGELQVDVYILDDDHYVDRLVLHEPLPADVEDQDPTKWTIMLHSYNEPVTISVPTEEAS